MLDGQVFNDSSGYYIHQLSPGGNTPWKQVAVADGGNPDIVGANDSNRQLYVAYPAGIIQINGSDSWQQVGTPGRKFVCNGGLFGLSPGVVGPVKDCKPLQTQVLALQKQIADIESSPGYIQGPDGPHPGKPDPVLLAEVEGLQKQLAVKQSAFDACEHDNQISGSIFQHVTGTSWIEIRKDATRDIVAGGSLLCAVDTDSSGDLYPVQWQARVMDQDRRAGQDVRGRRVWPALWPHSRRPGGLPVQRKAG